MDVVAVGVGGAGGRIVDELHRDDASRQGSYLAGSHVLDTDTASLDSLCRVPRDRRHPFGVISFDGNGADGDREAAADAMAEQGSELRREIDASVTAEVTAIVLVAGLGGGTGAGATPPLVEEMRAVYDRPVYCVSVLPTSRSEDEAANAARGLEALDGLVDCQIGFDNDDWVGQEERVSDRLTVLNRELADRIGTLFLAGEASAGGDVGGSVVDEADVAATLATGGLATVGYASPPVSKFRQIDGDSFVDSLRARLLEEATDAEKRDGVLSTVQWAVRGQFTLDCDPADSSAALLLVAGPPDWLHRGAIAEGRDWVAELTGDAELRSGDAPTPEGDSLSVLLVLAGIENAPRIEELQWF